MPVEGLFRAAGAYRGEPRCEALPARARRVDHQNSQAGAQRQLPGQAWKGYLPQVALSGHLEDRQS